ncbi:hypothetical protein F5Y07DRAFT_321929 [Xylaria sp. FL0933]|nr:hypothetical protein F5Y07DRAFT_321929 [Xylaria sp. FL0933]
MLRNPRRIKRVIAIAWGALNVVALPFDGRMIEVELLYKKPNPPATLKMYFPLISTTRREESSSPINFSEPTRSLASKSLPAPLTFHNIYSKEQIQAS